jgi:hypothetical protein
MTEPPPPPPGTPPFPGSPYPSGPPPHGPAPAPAGRGSCLLAVVVSVVLVIGGLAAVTLVRSLLTEEESEPPAKTGPAEFTAGGCVRVRVQPSPLHTGPGGQVMYSRAEYAPALCNDPAAYARITKMGEGTAVPELLGDRALEKLGCPVDTDEFAQLRLMNLPTDLACLRRLKPPHPGDPGQGGGLVRAGDCVQMHNRNYYGADLEVACTNEDWIVKGTKFGKKWFGQVIKRADTARDCPRPAIYTITLRTGKSRVLCIAKKGGWLPAVGDCVEENILYAGVNKPFLCSDEFLAGKIMALVEPGSRCPAGSQLRKVPGYLLRMCVKNLI